MLPYISEHVCALNVSRKGIVFYYFKGYPIRDSNPGLPHPMASVSLTSTYTRLDSLSAIGVQKNVSTCATKYKPAKQTQKHDAMSENYSTGGLRGAKFYGYHSVDASQV